MGTLSGRVFLKSLLRPRKIPRKLSEHCFKTYPEFDWKYLCDPKNKETILNNISMRKGVGDINKVHDLWADLHKADSSKEKLSIEEQLLNVAKCIPNTTHQDVLAYGEEPKTMWTTGTQQEDGRTYREFDRICEHLGLLRQKDLACFTGARSYYLQGILAELEWALIEFGIDRLKHLGFKLVSVPDLIHPNIVEACGLSTETERTQVYKLDPRWYGDVCLSGTSEMALAASLANEVLHQSEMPLRLAALSRCYRAETSGLKEERGIYRVHQFTKVEMFGVTANETGNESEELLQEFISIQEALYQELELCYRVLDMPPGELGAPAHRKYDIEAWMPGRKMYGEISSASNCTDYQSRRLSIKYDPGQDGSLKHVHTLNGTALAIPRLLIALLETHQTNDFKVRIPGVLRPYLDGKEFITREERVPRLKPSRTGEKKRK